MNELISNEELLDTILDRDLLKELSDWYSANGLGCVYLNAPVTIDWERRIIWWTEDVSEVDGPHVTEDREGPLLVEPPATLRM
jgi:hypothetical protein